MLLNMTDLFQCFYHVCHLLIQSLKFLTTRRWMSWMRSPMAIACVRMASPTPCLLKGWWAFTSLRQRRARLQRRNAKQLPQLMPARLSLAHPWNRSGLLRSNNVMQRKTSWMPRPARFLMPPRKSARIMPSAMCKQNYLLPGWLGFCEISKNMVSSKSGRLCCLCSANSRSSRLALQVNKLPCPPVKLPTILQQIALSSCSTQVQCQGKPSHARMRRERLGK